MANKITIDTEALGISWTIASTYRFELEEGFVIEDGGELQPSPANANVYSVTTNSSGPSVAYTVPANGTTGVLDNSQIIISFNRYVKVNSGNIRVYKSSDNSLLATISITDTSKVTFNNDSITVILDNVLTSANTAYYFLIDASIVKDWDGFNSVAVTSSGAISYTTGGPPAINTTSPATAATYVANNTSLTITFDRRVKANAGYINLYKVGTTDTLVHSFDITTAAKVTVSDYTIVVDLTGYIKSYSTYYFLLDAGVVKDYGGILSPAISDHFAIRYSTTIFLLDPTVIKNDGQYATSNAMVYLPDYGSPKNISLSDSYLLVGTPRQTNNSSFLPEGDNAGAVYVYNTTNGTLSYTFTDPNHFQSSANDYFGASVSVSGTTCIVGAPGEDSANGTTLNLSITGTGGQVLFSYTGPNFETTDRVIVITGTNSGTGAISGYTSGQYYYFRTTGTDTGILLSYPTKSAVTTTAGSTTGLSVSMTDTQNSGKVYVINLTGSGVLRSMSNPNSDGYLYNDRYGESLALSSTTSLVGAPYEFTSGSTTIPDVTITSVSSRFLVGSAFSFNTFRSNADYLNTPIDYIPITITGTLSGTGSISGYVSGKTYWTKGYINGATTQIFQLYELDDTGTNISIVTTTGTTTGLTFTINNPRVGKAYLQNINDGSLLYTLSNPNTQSGQLSDYFGYQVAMSPTYSAVSAKGNTASGLSPFVTSDNNSLHDGAVASISSTLFRTVDTRVLDYTQVKITGTLTGTATIAGYTSGNVYWIKSPANNLLGADPYGYSFSITSTWGGANIALGVGTTTGLTFSFLASNSSGKVYAFTNSNGQLARTFTSPDSAAYLNNQFGFSTAINGDNILISAPGESASDANGRAYLFSISSGGLLQTFKLGSEAAGYSPLGFTVALNSKYAFCWGREEPTDDYVGSGNVYIFELSTGILLSKINNPNPSGSTYNDLFGVALAVTDNYIVGAATYEDPKSGTDDTGTVYIFKEDT